MFFKKRNVKHALEKRTESTYHGMSVVAWPGAIWHSKSVDRHSKSAEWHSSRTKWHVGPPSYIHAIPCSRNFFLRLINIQKDFLFLIKLRHSNVSNSLVFKKSSLA